MIDATKKAIHQRYRLPTTQGGFNLADNIKVYPDDQSSCGFRLDNQCSPPLAFFSSNPPRNLAKMCDAIILYEDGNGTYCILIEQKTSNQSQFKKQLANGKLFCEWLIALCKEHNYTPREPVQYFGVLVWKPPPIPPKGTTTHQPPQAKKDKVFDKFFDVRNDSYVDVAELILSPPT